MPKPAPKRQKATEAGEDLVHLYLEDISRHALLTKDDEARLARRIEAGAAARAELHDDVTRARRRQLEWIVLDADETMFAARFERVLAPLEPDERAVVRLRFGMGRSGPLRVEEVAEHLGLPPETVRRLEGRALAKLRYPCSGQDLHDLLATG